MPWPRRRACSGTRVRRDRSRVDRLTVPRHAARGGRRPRARPVLRSLRARRRPRIARRDAERAHGRGGGRACRRLGGTRPWVRRCPGTLRETVQRWVAYVEWSSDGDPLPALAQALDWCGRHVPEERPPVLLWGDVRLGNLVFDSERHVTAVLDWDLASLGPREMDLGWHFGLEFMMEALFGGRLSGFPGVVDRSIATSAARGTRYGISLGTRSSRWCAPWPSTTATSASPVNRVDVRTRWGTSCWLAWSRPQPRRGEAHPSGAGRCGRPIAPSQCACTISRRGDATPTTAESGVQNESSPSTDRS